MWASTPTPVLGLAGGGEGRAGGLQFRHIHAGMVDGSIIDHGSSDASPSRGLAGEPFSQRALRKAHLGGTVSRSYSPDDAFLVHILLLPLGHCTSQSKAPATGSRS